MIISIQKKIVIRVCATYSCAIAMCQCMKIHCDGGYGHIINFYLTHARARVYVCLRVCVCTYINLVIMKIYLLFFIYLFIFILILFIIIYILFTLFTYKL